MNDWMIDWEKDQDEHRNMCWTEWCLKCNHAEMLQVERSNSHVRCGCKASKNYGTWSYWCIYSSERPEECPDFSEITDESRMRMMNLAWELSCDRKGEWLHCCGRRANSRPVRIEGCLPHFGVPFPQIGPADGISTATDIKGNGPGDRHGPCKRSAGPL